MRSVAKKKKKKKQIGNRKQEKKLEAKTVAPSTFAIFSFDSFFFVRCCTGERNARPFLFYTIFVTTTIKSLWNPTLYVYLFLTHSFIHSFVHSTHSVSPSVSLLSLCCSKLDVALCVHNFFILRTIKRW